MGIWSWLRGAKKDLSPVEQPKAEDAPPVAMATVAESTGAAWKDWTCANAIQYGLKASTWVYICVRRHQDYLASVPWFAERLEGKAWVREDDSDLGRLIAQPNPHQEWSDLIRILAANEYLCGNEVWLKNRAQGQVRQLWSLRPDYVTPVPSVRNYLSHYLYTIDNGKLPLSVKDVIHYQFPNPENPWWGLGPLQAGARAVDIDVEATNYNKQALQNMGTPSGIWAPKQQLTVPQWQAACNAISVNWQGAENAGKVMVATGDGEFTRLQLSPQELMFIETRKLGSVEICAIMMMQPPLAGIYEHATYSNMQEARAIQWEDTEIPHLTSIRERLNLSLAPDFGPGWRLNFDLGGVPALWGRWQARLAAAKDLWGMGVPFAAINQRLGLGFSADEVPYAEMGFIPSGLQPTGAPGEELDLEGGQQEPNESQEGGEE